MTRLVRPDVRLRRSWAEAVEEFAADGSTMHGYGLWDYEPLDLSEEGCRALVTFLLAQGDADVEPPSGLVHCSYFWIVEGDEGDPAGEFVGYLALRHSLTPWLLEEGGHIGYSVRPSRRRQGHASRALRQALPYAAALGLDRVLVTADEDNVASWAVIEGAGGVYEDNRKGKRRYWIPTAPDVTGAGSGPRSGAGGAGA